MEYQLLDGAIYSQMIAAGTNNLRIHAQEINNLNVFPIPDGDTGDNMLMTMMGGKNAIPASEKNLSAAAKKISSGMLLGARGNSGVILSQFFDGISAGFEGLTQADSTQIGNAFKKGVKQAYESVMTPTEGTILTVAKDSTEYACSTNAKTPVDFFDAFLREAKLSLERTPDLLPVLKKAGVVDSGGAGLIYIIKGMKQFLLGEAQPEVKDNSEKSEKPQLNLDLFNEDSELEFGYCTELMLRLQNKKTNPAAFDVETIKSFLNTIGNSVVAFKTGSIIKLHVHTMTPDKVLAFCQQFGEFLTVKIENMSLQHNNLTEEDDDTLVTTVESEKQERKPFGIVAVASGEGIKQTFLDYGADYIVDGGQSMNPSAEDFINAFDKVNADTIFVLPNNGNVILSAQQAAKIYTNSQIKVIESKSIGEGFAVITMIDTECGNTEEIIEQCNFAMDGVSSYYISHCVRDAQMDGLSLHTGDYIGFCDKNIITSNSDRRNTGLSTIDKMDFSDHEVCILINGIDSTTNETTELSNYIKEKHPDIEVYIISGGQDIYSYIMILE